MLVQAKALYLERGQAVKQMCEHRWLISSPVHQFNMDIKSQIRTYGFQFATGKLTVPSEIKEGHPENSVLDSVTQVFAS